MLSVKQQQEFLKERKYYTGKVDGIKGKLTTKAIKAFQAAYKLTADGIWGEKTNAKALTLIWRKYPNFKRSEFVCKCGGKHCKGDTAEMEEEVLEILQEIRNTYKRAVIVTSGVRCTQHNRNVGGVPNSRHLTGHAADFKISGVSGSELRDLCYDLGCRYSYVITANTVHVDVK